MEKKKNETVWRQKMSSKWTSRKFWIAIIAGISGMVTAIWGASTGATVETVAGLALTILITLGYITAEAKVDSARISANGDTLVNKKK